MKMKHQRKFKSRSMRKYACLTSLLFFSAIFLSSAYAQEITGTITSSVDNETLIGATITVKGTSSGTVTDIDGKYFISAPGDAILVVSYTGFTTQEVPVNNRTTINLSLDTDTEILDEVVVVGYGTQKKGTLTGAVAAIGGAELEKSLSPNLGAALAGKVAGLYIDTQSAQPGADNPAIRVRGTNTFNNTSALVVIDGIPNRAGGLSRINPADIESISVLKDASAAIYGARAANGVILVTTKRGKTGRPSIQLSSSYGVQTFTKTPEMLKGAEYMDLVNLLNVYKLPTNEWDAANAVRGTPFTRPNGEVLNPTYSTDRINNTAAGLSLIHI